MRLCESRTYSTRLVATANCQLPIRPFTALQSSFHFILITCSQYSDQCLALCAVHIAYREYAGCVCARISSSIPIRLRLRRLAWRVDDDDGSTTSQPLSPVLYTFTFIEFVPYCVEVCLYKQYATVMDSRWSGNARLLLPLLYGRMFVCGRLRSK